MSIRSSAGSITPALIRASSGDRRSRFSTNDSGALPLSVCSTLNLSAQAIAGLHSSWSIATTTPIIVVIPHRIATVFPSLAADCRYDPSPGSRKSRFPSTNISQAIRKNQPPATDTIEFHTSPITPCGNSSCTRRCQRENRYIRAASINSLGIAFTDA